MSSALEVLKKYGEEQGLEAERIPFVLLNGLEEEETLVTFAIGSGGRRAPEVAAAWLKGGPDPSYIEYECRDDTGAPQAIGIVKVQGWIKGSSPASTRACLMLTMLGMWVANFPTELASMSVIAHHHVAKWELNTAVEESLQGQPPQIQERFRRAYAWWGIPVNEEKALFQCREAGKLGALIDGKHCILMDIMDEREKTKWATALLHEFLVECFLPLPRTNLRARIDPLVTCSDASETGGGMMYSARLTWSGREEAKALLDGELQAGVT